MSLAACLELQKATEPAALADVACPDVEPSQRIDRARRVFDSYIRALDSDLSPESPDIAIHGFSVEVGAGATVFSPLLAITNTEGLSISTSSQASFSQTAGTAGGRALVLALDPTENGISLGTDAHLDASCGVHVNSTKTDNGHPALEPGSDSILTSSTNRVVAGPEEGVDAHQDATINWGSHSYVDLKAPTATTGVMAPYRGILIYSKRGQSTAKDHIIGCHQTARIQGAVYSPSTAIDIGSNGNVTVELGEVADWTVWIARRFEIGSHKTLTVRSDITAGTTPSRRP